MGRLLMGIQGGTTGVVADVDGQFQALKISSRSLNCSPTGGYYRVAKNFVSGPGTGVAANGAIFSMRWTSATQNAIILYFKWHWTVNTAFTGNQYIDHGLYIARSWSTNDTVVAGGTLTMTGNNAKKRTSMTSTAFGQIAYGTTSTLTAGTRTVDANPLVYKGNYGSAQGLELIDYGLFNTDIEQHPVVLAANEGLVLNNITVFPAAGVLSVSVEVAWAEVLTTVF